MTLTAPEHATHAAREGVLDLVPRHRVAVLHHRICRSVTGRSTARPAPWLDRLVHDGIDAFVASGGSGKLAAERMADAFREIGEHHARRGIDADVLSHAFARTRASVLQGLPMTLGDALNGAAVARLRHDIVIYLTHLHQHALAAHDRTQRIMAMSHEDRSTQLRIALFRPGTKADTAALARAASVAPTTALRAVVSTGAALPHTVLAHGETIAGLDLWEALVPVGWDDTELAQRLTSQAVVGPPAVLHELSDSVDVTRRAAALLRDGTVRDDRPVVPCADLAGSLVVGGNPYLNELIVAKRLQGLEQMGTRRRVQLGELLLEWLERGIPLTRLATVLDVNAQTAHSRMKVLREIFGDALDEPAARLELILALHTALPRWRDQVQKSL